MVELTVLFIDKEERRFSGQVQAQKHSEINYEKRTHLEHQTIFNPPSEFPWEQKIFMNGDLHTASDTTRLLPATRGDTESVLTDAVKQY